MGGRVTFAALPGFPLTGGDGGTTVAFLEALVGVAGNVLGKTFWNLGPFLRVSNSGCMCGNTPPLDIVTCFNNYKTNVDWSHVVNVLNFNLEAY